MLKFNVFTLFPELYPGPLGSSLIGNAIDREVLSLNIVDIKKYGIGSHNTLDDKIYGGGSGMLMRPDVLERALNDNLKDPHAADIICMSAKGELFDNNMSQALSSYNELSVICPRYEGVDQRVIDFFNIKEVSIGNFVLSNGDISCYVLIDSIARNLPGVLGDEQSLLEESFNIQGGLLEYSQYTKPVTWNQMSVPEVLLSGHHKNITSWRRDNSIANTEKYRPDLLNKK